MIEVTPRIVRSDIDYSDARNYTTQGNRILDEGESSNLLELEPDAGRLKDVKSNVEEIKKTQEEMSTPLEKKLEEKGY